MKALETGYAALDLPFTHSLWAKHQNEGVSIENFRADGSYLGQGTLNEDEYRIMYEYVKRNDKWDLLGKMPENGEFGALTFEFEGKRVSRDLLDSIMEIYFVHEALGLEGSYLPGRWLDIGAGYGRLARRLLEFKRETAQVTCIDAIPVSTFLCEYYLRDFERANVLPLHGIESLQPGQFDIACNIHSWSECTADAIQWWMGQIIRLEIPYLFIVPHDERWVCVNEDGSIGNFRFIIEEAGYTEFYTRPKYHDGSPGLYPEVHYHAFRRSANG